MLIAGTGLIVPYFGMFYSFQICRTTLRSRLRNSYPRVVKIAEGNTVIILSDQTC
jgi:hypothetical protein